MMKKSIVSILIVGFLGNGLLNAQCLQTAPYLQTFDINTTPTCWTNPYYWFFANSSSSNPSGYTPTGLAATIGDHTGNGGFFIYARGGFANIELTSPEIDVSSLTTPALSFWMFEHGTSGTNNVLEIDVYDGTWHQTVATFSQSNPNWTNKIVNLSAFVSDTIKVRFRKTLNYDVNQEILLDDIFIGELPTCLPPNFLVVDSINDVKAFVNVAGVTANVWEYEYGISGFALGSGTRDTSAQSVISLASLTPYTAYDVYVRNVCSVTDTSVWMKASFTTLCGVYATPYTETFNLTKTPDCWDNYSTVYPGYLVGFSTIQDHTGNNGASAYWDFYANAPILHLESPMIDISTLSQPYLSFYRLAQTQNRVALAGCFVSAQAFDGTNWINLKTYNSADINWQYKYLDLSGFNLPDTTKFRFKYQKIGGPLINVVRDYLDDFTIGEKPNCLPADSLFVLAKSTNTIRIGWDGAGTYEVGYGPYNTLYANLTTQVVNADSAVITNLQAAAGYSIYTRKICGTDTSNWSEALFVITDCAQNNSLSYVEDFDLLVPSDSSVAAICWQTAASGITKWYANRYGTPSQPTGPNGDYSGGGYGVYMYTEASPGNSGDTSDLISPSIYINPKDSAFLTFRYHMFGNTIGRLQLDIFDGTQWHDSLFVKVGQQQLTQSSSYKLAILPLANFVTDSIVLRFRAMRGAPFFGDLAIDAVRLIDSCVYGFPKANFTESYDSLSTNGFYISFSSYAGNSNLCTWYFGDGTSDTGNFVVHAYQANGLFTAWQVVQNQCGRVDSVFTIIQIGGIGLPENDKITSPNVFPNPVQQFLQISQLWQDDIKRIVLLNMLGQEVQVLQTKDVSATLDVGKLPDGVYVLFVSTEKKSFSKKIVISRE